MISKENRSNLSLPTLNDVMSHSSTPSPVLPGVIRSFHWLRDRQGLFARPECCCKGYRGTVPIGCSSLEREIGEASRKNHESDLFGWDSFKASLRTIAQNENAGIEWIPAGGGFSESMSQSVSLVDLHRRWCCYLREPILPD